MLRYERIQNGFTLNEQKNADDVEFTLLIHDTERYLPVMKQIRKHFDADEIYTDVLIYIHKDNEYQFIVRQDSYVDFVLILFKYHLIKSVSWN